MSKVKISDILTLIEPHKTIEDFPGYQIRVSSKDNNTLHDVIILEATKKGLRRIEATSADVVTEDSEVFLDMKNVSFSEDGTGGAHAERFIFKVSRSNDTKSNKPFFRRVKDKQTWVLIKDIIVSKIDPPLSDEGKKEISRSLVEVNMRICLALACFCFVLIGIPLGVKQHRKESSIGIGISLAMAGAFYLFNITAESLAKKADFYDLAYYVVWVPVAICIVLGTVLINKNN